MVDGSWVLGPTLDCISFKDSGADPDASTNRIVSSGRDLGSIWSGKDLMGEIINTNANDNRLNTVEEIYGLAA